MEHSVKLWSSMNLILVPAKSGGSTLPPVPAGPDTLLIPKAEMLLIPKAEMVQSPTLSDNYEEGWNYGREGGGNICCGSVAARGRVRGSRSRGGSRGRPDGPVMETMLSSTPNNNNIINVINYGSEPEESADDEEGDFDQSMMVPRTARIFMCEEDDYEVEEGHVNVSVQGFPSAGHSLEARTSASFLPTSPVAETSMAASPVPPISAKPTDKFDFEWRGFSLTQISPNLRREPFSRINTGPTVSFTTPYEAFTAIWDGEIIEMIVTETNIYAQQQKAAMLDSGTIRPTITQWQDTTVNEMYTFLAIVLAMGVVVKSRVEEYWSASKDIFSTPGFKHIMSYNRFRLLSKCLHFSDILNFDCALLTRSQAKLLKIKPIIDHLNSKFSKLYNMSQNIALDESLIMWKGWLDINQFIRNKAPSIGIKTYEICESQTGYLWRFEVYAGHNNAPEKDDPLSGTIPALVLKLLNGLEHKGHTIWMDNLYSSPALARELKVRGFDCVGTLRTNRQFVPPELSSVTKNDMVVGQVIACTSGDVDIILWMNKNPLAFISTYHGLSISSSGGTEKPAVAHDFTVCMGGVDRKDQTLSMYPIERRLNRVWYKKLFRRLLNVSVFNAYILLNKKTLTHRNFRKDLINSILKIHSTPQAPQPTQPTVTQSFHYPAQYDVTKPGVVYRKKRPCVYCKKRTTTYCQVCQLAMCTFTCFAPFHNSH